MRSVYIYTHMGLGDHIIANGLVRTVADNYDKIYLFCKPHNFNNVAFMYKDLEKLKIITMNDGEVKQFISFNPNNNYLIVGHEKFFKEYNNSNLKIDEIFYKMANVPIENKWSRFYVERNIEREKEVYRELGLDENIKYAFVHDSENRKIIKQLPDIKIIKPDLKYSLFDLLYTIENSEEIHCVNSSFFCLIDSIGINKDHMYLHAYAIPDSNEKLFGKFKSNWKIIN